MLPQNRSKLDANSALILGHTTSGMGERSLTIKTESLMRQAGIKLEPSLDIIELLGSDYTSFAKLNYALADNDHELMEGLRGVALPQTDIILILSWCFSLAALFATDLHRSAPTIAKLYAHHPTERILSKLYEPADLLITESLLANERGATYGIDPSKMLYIPHVFHPLSDLPKKKSKKKVIGTVGRLEYGKNCEFAIEAVRRLAAQGEDVVLVLKGDFPDDTPYPDYQPRLLEMLQTYQNEPWLQWDRSWTPYPDVVEEYAQFDLLLHPSGAEGGSHVVVECLGLGIPCVVLNCSTNPYLFKNLATFVKTTGEIRPAQTPFYIPDIEDLVHKLQCPLTPDLKKVHERFHPDVARARLPLLFERDPERIKKVYEEECRRYDL